MSKVDRSTVSAKHLADAIISAAEMDIGQKELVCDVLFTTQPNLLSSVLAQKYLGASIENIDVLLNILIVLHLAIEKSGQTLTMISKEEQERELKYLVQP